MVNCSIPHCKSRSDGKGKGRTEKKPLFFSFPVKNSEVLNKWLELCPSVNASNLKKSYICSVHFQATDYKAKPLYLQNVENYSPKRRRILDNAIPTINMILEKNGNYVNIDIAGHNLNRSPKSENHSFEEMVVHQVEVANPSSNTAARLSPQQIKELQDRLLQLEKEQESQLLKDSEMQKKLLKLEEENTFLRNSNRTRWQKLREENRSLKTNCSTLRKHVKRLKSKQYLHSQVKNVLRPVFTPKQTYRILHPEKKHVHWDIESISRAITLKSISAQGYRLMRKMNYPLPGRTCLSKWASTMNMEEGILGDVLSMMKVKGSVLLAHEKLVVLSFDEVYLSSKIELNKKYEQVVGPHKTAQVCVARGLFSNWKQPIFYKFDQKLTSEILNLVITALWNIGYTVVAIVTDLGGNNPQAFENHKIGIDEEQGEKCFFYHPCKSTYKIFVFADVPHLIKLFRNHFLDEGYFFRKMNFDGTITLKTINKEIISELLALNERDELKVAFKLTRDQLEVVKAKRQKVSLATKLFSKSTARAIKWAGEANLLKYKDWEKAAEVFELFNDWFDVFDSKVVYGYKFGQQPYGKNLDKQNSILDNTTKFIKAIRFGKRTKYRPFQKGIILNNKGLQLILPYLKSTFSTPDFQISYILTNRLNQDCLENLFAILRAMGRTNDHPSALDFQYRLKWYTLGKHAEIIFSKSKNTEDDNDKSLIQVGRESLLGNGEMEGRRLIEIPEISFDKADESPLNESQNSMHDDPDDSTALIQDLGIEDFDDYEEGLGAFAVNKPAIPTIGTSEISYDKVRNIVKKEALKYITGYTASKFINKYPNLGSQTRKLILTEKRADWLLTVSDGYLVYPSDMLLQVARIVRKVFLEFHGEKGLSKERFIIKRVADMVFKKICFYKIDIVLVVITHMVKTHTYIRLKEMQRAQKAKTDIAKVETNRKKAVKEKKTAERWSRETKQMQRHAKKKYIKFID